MKFETGPDLERHRSKFCKQYSNVGKLDDRMRRLANLKPDSIPKKVFRREQLVDNNKEDLRHRKQNIDVKNVQNRKNYEDLINQAKMREDRKLNNLAEEEHLKQALKKVKQHKAGYLKEDKLKEIHELEERRRKVQEELKQLDQDVLNGVKKPQKDLQEKVDGSEYFQNQRRNSTEFMKQTVEEKARMKLKQEILAQKKAKLDNGAPGKRMTSPSPYKDMGKQNKSSSLLNVGNGILNTSNPYQSADMQQSQDRIKRLMEDRKRTMRQLDKTDSVFDELDQLQVSVNNGYNTDINKYRENVRNHTHNIRTDREMPARERADRLGNMRAKISSFDPSLDGSARVNYHVARPMMQKRIDKLNGVIRSERARETNDERRKVMESMNVKVPNYHSKHPSVINNVNRTERSGQPQPMISNYKKQSSRQSRRQATERLTKAHTENRIPDSRAFLPDVGHFKQNLNRPEDLETEERAIMNMYAQDFDDLKILDMLKNNEELYQHKLQQYKELSHSRIEAEKALQGQRLNRIRDYFGKERYEEEKKLELERWMDEQEKSLIARRLQERLNAPKTPEYVPTPTPKPRLPSRPTRPEGEYDPELGFNFHMDYVFNIDKGICNQMKLTYAIFNQGEMKVGNKNMGPVLMTPDPFSITHEKAQFSMEHPIKLIEADRNTNLIIELQIPDKRDPNRFQALGWSLVNLFTVEQIKLNKGVYKLPVYDLPTNPMLSVNDIYSLKPLSSFMCVRISVKGDSVADMKSNMHPTEYLVPLIHQRGQANMASMPGLAPTIEQPQYEDESQIQRDPFYSNTGLILYLHFLKNFPEKPKAGDLSIRASLAYANDTAKDQFNNACYWITERIPYENNLTQIPNNMFKIQEVVNVQALQRNDTVLPLTLSTTWFKNFYEMLWNDGLKNDLYLFLEIIENGAAYPTGVTVLKINHADGTLKYGSYELPVYKYPIKDFENPELNDQLGYTILFVLNEPKPEADPRNPTPAPQIQNEPEVPLPTEETKGPNLDTFPDTEKSNPIETSDIGKKDESNEAYIPNTLKQFDEKPYEPDEIIVLYIDSARYLPENVTISRVSLRAVNMGGNLVMGPVESPCILQMSTCQKPYFGMREELVRRKNPTLDDTTVLCFRIDAVDRNELKPVIVGYAFFPLFVDPTNGHPAKMENEDAALNTGKYQLPIFCQTPRLARPVTFESLTQYERIPCATLLIRVERAPVDPYGNSISVADVDDDQRFQLGMLKLPPKYSSGEYNNSYVDLFEHEMRVYKEKVKRNDPLVTGTMPMIKAKYAKDKSFLKRLKKAAKKKSIKEASDMEVVMNIFGDPTKYTDDLIDINYFSRYIMDIGFRFCLDMVLNCDPHSMFVAICSINPPGALYQDEVGYEKVIVFNEINFSSHVKSQKFMESFYAFVNVPENEVTHMIIDVKSVKFKKKGPTEVKDYAWTIFPIFTHLETDGDEETKEFYVRSGLHMMPLFQGKVREDLVHSLVENKDPWTHLMDQRKKKLAPISLLPKAGAVVRCVDNQREGHFAQLADWKRINYDFCPNKGSGYEYNEKVIRNMKKGNQLESLVPKDKTLRQVQDEIVALVRDKYGI